MSAPFHHFLNTFTHPGCPLSNPSAAHQDAGGLENTLGLPVQLIGAWPAFEYRTGDENTGTVLTSWGETLEGMFAGSI